MSEAAACLRSRPCTVLCCTVPCVQRPCWPGRTSQVLCWPAVVVPPPHCRISLFIIQQGGGRFDWDDTPLGKACWISACVGAGSTAVSVALQALLIRRRVAADVKAQEAEHAAAAAEAAAADLEPGAILEGEAWRRPAWMGSAAQAPHGGVAASPRCLASGASVAAPFSVAAWRAWHAGAHDDLIADIIGRGDPLAFGFSAQSSDEGASCSLPAGHACAPPPHGAPGSSQGGGAAAAVPGSAARTPAALHKFRQSQMWSMVSHGANVDIHEVCSGGVVRGLLL